MRRGMTIRMAAAVAALLASGTTASGEYLFQALGTFAETASEAAAINDQRQIAGSLSGC